MLGGTIMSLYFCSETIFVNAYYRLGKISVSEILPGETTMGITVVEGTIRTFEVPFYNSADRYCILREYSNILEAKINQEYKKAKAFPLLDWLKNPCIDWQEGYDFTQLVEMYGNITDEKRKKVNDKYSNYPEVLKCIEEAGEELRKEYLKID